MNSELASNFRKTEVGVIPEDWIVNELGNLTVFVTDGKHGDCQNQANSGYYFLSAKDVNGGRLDYSNAREITKEDFLDTHKRTKLEARNVLLTNSGTIGRLAMAEDTEITKRTTFQKSVAVIKPKALLDSYFLYYYLVANTRRVQETSGGTTQKNLLLKDLRAFKIAIPSLNVQKAQTSLLISIDSKIESNLKMNVILETVGEAVFRRWFVDFEFPNEEGKPYTSSGGQMVQSEELNKEIPEGWKAVTLGEVAEFVRGFSYSGAEKSKTEGELAFVTLNSIFEGGGFKRKFSYLTSNRLKERHFVKEGDIVIANTEQTKTGTLLGFPALVEFPNNYGKDVGCFSHHITKVIPQIEEMKYYLYYYLHFSQLNAIKYHTGSVIWALDVKGFAENEKIALPNGKVLATFSEIMGTIFQRRLLNNKQTSTLTVVRDMLLPRLMSGKIRVPVNKEKVESVGYA